MTANPVNVPGLGNTADQGNDKYETLDGALNGTVPGMKGTLIPSAVPGKSGQSRAFDPSQPMPVHVDPEYADGFVVDPTQLKETDVASAMSRTGDPVEAMRQLSMTAAKAQQPAAMPPAQEPPPIPPMPAPPPIGDQLPPTPEPTPTPLDQPMTAQMPEIDYTKLAAAMVQAQQPAPTPQPAPPAMPPVAGPPAPATPVTQRENPMAQPEAPDPRDPLARELDIPFIDGAMASKPQYEVFFDLGPLGQAAGRYHGVVETDRLVVLLYDTRFENGFQYLPPSGQQKPMRMECPKIGKTFHAVNAGLTYSLGCIDQLVLIKADPETPPPTSVMG